MKRILETIFKVLFLVALIGWVTIVFYDYFRSKNGKDPKFCIKEVTHKYSDGDTYECLGLGYKMYRYNRSFSAVQFGPFFIKERTEGK